MVRRKWIRAGVLGAFATATSPLALPLALAAAVPAVQALRTREAPHHALGRVPGADRVCRLPHVPRSALSRSPFLVAPWAPAWGVSVDFGRSLLGLLAHLWHVGYQGPAWLEGTGLAVVVAGALALWRARLPACINAYYLGVVLVLFASNNLGFEPRLLTWAFPALVAVAKVTRHRTWTAIVVVFACLLPIVFLAYTTLADTTAQP